MSKLSESAQAIRTLLSKAPSTTQTVLPLMYALKQEEFVALHEWIVSERLAASAFNCLKEFFKAKDNKPFLIYFLANTPLVNAELHKSFLSYLNDEELLTLIEQRLAQNKEHPDYTSNLNDVLLCFCERLYADQSATGPINQWPQKSYAKQLTHQLMSTPEGVVQLAQINSTLYSLTSWNSYYSALKYRIDALLNEAVLTPEKAKYYALIWLAHGAAHPEQLLTLFTTINSSEENKTSSGKNNSLLLKQACWSLLKAPAIYTEDAFLALFKSSQPQLVQAVLVKEYASYNPYHQAQWLAQTNDDSLNPSGEQMLALLHHSLHGSSYRNWHQASTWLEQQNLKEQLSFIQRLMASSTHPLFNQYAQQLIMQCSQFKAHSTAFNERELSWLGQFCPAEKRSSWLALVHQCHEQQKLNVGLLYSLLPADEKILSLFFTKELFNPPSVLAQIVAELHLKTNSELHFTCTYQYISEKNKAWMQAFLERVLPTINKVGEHLISLSVINSLILDRPELFTAEHTDDAQLINDYLNLLFRLSKIAPKEEQRDALKQITFQLLHALINKSPAWAETLFNSVVVRLIIMQYVPKAPFATDFIIGMHPLTELLVRPAANQLDEASKKHELMQLFLHELLVKAPERLKAEQFVALFNWLEPANKTTVSRAILSLAEHKKAQQQNMHLIIAFISAKEAFRLFTSSKNIHLLKSIMTHPNALEELTENQWYLLFSALSASELIAILANDQIPVASRAQCSKAFYLAYKHDELLLAEQLKQWSITDEQLIVLANFTVDAHSLFRNLLAASKRQLSLTHPRVTTISLNPDGYLYQQIKEALQDNSLLLNAQMLKQFPQSELTAALQEQLLETERLHALFDLFTPFKTDKKSAIALLQSARWQQRLPLLHSGLLESLALYLNKKDVAANVRLAIEKTKLFQQTLAPFLQANVLPLNVLAVLYRDLLEYCAEMTPIAPEHVQKIENMLRRAEKDNAAIQHYSPPTFPEYFNLAPSSASLNKGDASILSYEESAFLTTAATIHKEWRAKNTSDPKKTFTNTLVSLLKEPQFIENEELNQWIMSHALLSPLSNDISTKTLEAYLTPRSLTQLTAHLTRYNEQLHSYQAAEQLINQLTSSPSIHEWAVHLLSQDKEHLEQLHAACQKAHLLFLSDFIGLIAMIKKLNLNTEQRAALLLYNSISMQKDISWLLSDIHSINERVTHASERFAQLNWLSYSYSASASNNEERLSTLTEKAISYIPKKTLALCLNSYVPLFTKEHQTQIFFTSVELCLNKLEQPTAVIDLLDEKTVSVLMNSALTQPVRYATFMEKLINSTHQKRCQQLIQAKLQAVLPQDKSTTCSDITQLQRQQLEQFSAEQLTAVMALQRLLYFAKPLEELVSFATEQDSIVQHKKRLFCANASLYHVLLGLKKSTALALEPWFTCLHDYELNTYKHYIALMDAWQAEEKKESVVFFHWLRWKAAFWGVSYNAEKELAQWLSKQSQEDLEHSIYLKQLLEHSAEQKKLIALFTYIVEHQPVLNPEQTAWLCGTCLEFSAHEPELISAIVGLNSWESLAPLLVQNKAHCLAVLTAALKEQRYSEEINRNEEKQALFIKHIESLNLSITNLQKLIQTTSNKYIKSLLIVHLLSQTSYSQSLAGPSFLEKITDKKPHQPSRLNAWVQQIHPSILSKHKINALSAETALSILCSIPHFHQLSAEQVQQLITKLPATAIAYWLNHYTTMPNAFYVLAHLMQAADATVYAEFNKLSDDKKEWLRYCLIEHLELFDMSKKIVQDCQQETLLVHALKLYLHGHRHPNYIQFIKQLTERLLNANHIFSLQAIPLLIRLHDDPHFTELSKNTAYLVNHNLKAHAQSGSVELFYEAGNINIPSMTQFIQIKPKYPEAKSKGLFSQMFQPLIASVENDTVPNHQHPLIDVLTEKDIKLMRAFDYFLMHCKENNQQLHKTLHHYLNYFAQEPCSDAQRKAVSHTATFITRKEIAFPIREAIYTAFLTRSNLFDKHISYCMLLFDAKRTLQHFGLRGSKEAYQQVINLCNAALEKLDSNHNEETVKQAKTALFEARTELAFAENNGFFSLLFRRVQQCWAYGWTGFFKPKAPTYVVPLLKNPSPAAPVEPEHSQPITSSVRKELSTLLEELRSDLSLTKLNELIRELDVWGLKPQKELEIRQQLHNLLHNLIQESQKNTDLARWLESHQTKLISNRFYLLEQLLAQEQQAKVEELLKELNEDSPHFNYLSQELLCPAVATLVLDSKAATSKTESKTGLLDSAASIVHSALGWTTVFNFFAGAIAPKAIEVAAEQPKEPAPLIP